MWDTGVKVLATVRTGLQEETSDTQSHPVYLGDYKPASPQSHLLCWQDTCPWSQQLLQQQCSSAEWLCDIKHTIALRLNPRNKCSCFLLKNPSVSCVWPAPKHVPYTTLGLHPAPAGNIPKIWSQTLNIKNYSSWRRPGSFTVSHFWGDSNNISPIMNSHPTANRVSETCSWAQSTFSKADRSHLS